MTCDVVEQRLSYESLRILENIVHRTIGPVPRFYHKPTQSAASTQSVLPAHVLVQKTVSLSMAGTLVLWTSVGDAEQTLVQRKLVALHLGLPKRAARHCHINPAWVRPEEQFGMLPGMVSPFLSPKHSTNVSAVIHTGYPRDEAGAVAISLSLYESLLIPIRGYRTVMQSYAQAVYLTRTKFIEIE